MELSTLAVSILLAYHVFSLSFSMLNLCFSFYQERFFLLINICSTHADVVHGIATIWLISLEYFSFKCGIQHLQNGNTMVTSLLQYNQYDLTFLLEISPTV